MVEEGRTMRILGVNAIGHHDASACLVEDGVLTALVEEERFTRVKHAVRQQPVHAVRWCLEARGLNWQDIDVLATPWVEEEHGIVAPPGYREDISFGVRDLGRDTDRWPDGLVVLLTETGGNTGRAPVLMQVSHHLAHAASAYWRSGMTEATVLVVDGDGDRISTTVAHGHDGEIKALRQFSTVDSLGQFYASMTDYLGFGFFGEGKLMGLAPYGTAAIEFPEIVLDGDGGYHIDLPGDLRRFDPAGSEWQRRIDVWERVLSGRFGPKRTRRDKPVPSRLDEWPQIDLDLAASTQRALEEALVHVVRGAIAATGCNDLVIAGGVGLNCAANGAIANLPDVGAFFVQPVAGDNGVPMGAALHASVASGAFPMATMRSAFLGPSFGDDDYVTALRDAGLPFLASSDVAQEAARRLTDGEVVCWFQGAMEAGPRALGHRSILASPTSAATRDRVNDVKRRSRWRPLSPSVNVESRTAFASGRISPFMIVAARVSPGWRERMPGVTHVDDSARPQTVDRDVDPVYWRLIDQHSAATGVPAVINTSFNGDDEPIVCTPAEAIRTFLRGRADALCLGQFVATRPSEGHE